MPEITNILSQFWQELKRRKVVRVITVYAAAAFGILELLSIIIEPLGLPDWTLQFAIVFLCIGFIIDVILSWIYDIKPEGGIVKTKPAVNLKKEGTPVYSGGWKIASYISFVVTVGLIVINIFPRSSKKVILDKSIAVLPFDYLGDEPDKQYLADGTMDEILLNLSKIKDLRVMSKTSVGQYRNTDKTIAEICEELDVAFVLEGSFQKSHNQVRLIVQLIETGKEGHAWAKKYDRNWQDIFAVQSEVAQLVAQAIQAVITPEEKQLIEKIPTANLTAYDFFRKGREEQENWWYDFDREALERAEVLFHKALQYDSTYAQAYTGLAYIYQAKQNRETVFTETSLDSMLILADIALSFDDQLSEAYVIRGRYYMAHNKKVEAANEFEKALQFNPNEWLAYYNIGSLYFLDDNVKTIDNYQKAASLHRGNYLPRIYQHLGHTYAMAGFMEKYRFYKEEALKLDDDSAEYYKALAQLEDANGNFEKAIVLGKKSYAMDSTDLRVMILLGIDHMYLGQLEESLEYWKKYVIRYKTLDLPLSLAVFRIGYAYLENGFKEEADNYFNIGFESYNDILESSRFALNFILHYDLATIYAVLGDKEKAFEHLRLFNRKQVMPFYMIKDIKNDPMFDGIRDEPEFQQIVRDVEAKYQAEHERVRQWLVENDML
jgi:TolB-like protein/lipopolysaccharide biosynthesis regulator YciM